MSAVRPFTEKEFKQHYGDDSKQLGESAHKIARELPTQSRDTICSIRDVLYNRDEIIGSKQLCIVQLGSLQVH
jgi:hypothetical protein